MTGIGKAQHKTRAEPEPERAPMTKKPSPARTLPERVTPAKDPGRNARGG